MSEDLVKALAVTAALTGTDLTEIQLEAMVRELAAYPADAVFSALRRCSREVKYRLTLADVIQRIDDGYPSPEEAWSLVPKSEWESAALCPPMLTALAEISGWMDDDLTGARIAFMRRYRELVEAARSNGTLPVWTASLGFDSKGRDAAKQEAQERNARIYGAQHYPPVPKPEPLPELPRGGDAVSGAIGHVMTCADRAEGKAQVARLREAMRQRRR
ncbi:MAG: hypothetical protein DWQ08_01340 [Proteobacteria bacterium]|nr:MAG: hypothetical protein DWQ08_01340 [Pseudomonadota bacterium]